jgi:transcriptional regulator with XRE-family HTH domain
MSTSTQTARRPARRPNRATLSDEIRDAIERDGRSPYAIARDAEVDPATLSRFLAGLRAMTTDTLDRLAPTLGLHVTAATRPKGRPRRPGPADRPAAAAEAEDRPGDLAASDEPSCPVCPD